MITRKQALAEFGLRHFPDAPPRVRLLRSYVEQLAVSKFGSLEVARSLASRLCSLCGKVGGSVQLLRGGSVCSVCESLRPDYRRVWISDAARRHRVLPSDFVDAGLPVFEEPSFFHEVKRRVFEQDAEQLSKSPFMAAARARRAAEKARSRACRRRRVVEAAVATDFVTREHGAAPSAGVAAAYIAGRRSQNVFLSELRASAAARLHADRYQRREEAFAYAVGIALYREVERWSIYQSCGTAMFLRIEDYLKGHALSPVAEFRAARAARSERIARVEAQMVLADVPRSGPSSWDAPHPLCWRLHIRIANYIRDGCGAPPSIADALRVGSLPWVSRWTVENHLAVVGGAGVVAVQLLLFAFAKHGVPRDIIFFVCKLAFTN